VRVAFIWKEKEEKTAVRYGPTNGGYPIASVRRHELEAPPLQLTGTTTTTKWQMASSPANRRDKRPEAHRLAAEGDIDGSFSFSSPLGTERFYYF
jgi:hypothetical protein